MPDEANCLEGIRVEGTVTQALPGAVFEVLMSDGQQLRAHVSASFRLHCLRILPGDRVRMEVAPNDWSRGRIVERL